MQLSLWPDGYAPVTSTSIDGLSGFEGSVAAGDGIERVGFTRRVYMCARANSGNDKGRGVGPWTLTGPHNVTKPSGLSGTIGFVGTKDDDVSPVRYSVKVTLTIKNWNKDWSYGIQEGDADPQQCTTGQSTDDQSTGKVELEWSLELSEKLTVEVFADNSCTTSLKKSTHTVPSS